MHTTLRRATAHACTTASSASACREHARSATLPRSRQRQRRHLTGTVDLLPKAKRPWELNGGQLFAVGETEEQYRDKDAVKSSGGEETVGSLMTYLSKDEMLLVDEDLAVSMETYGSLVCDVEERLMRGTLTPHERRRLLALRDTVHDNVLFPYPQQDHLDGLHRQCCARVSKRKNEPIDTFHQWCYMNHPPATNDSIPASLLFALRDSYVAYLKGVQVAAALDPELSLALSHPGARHYQQEFKRMLKSGRAFSQTRVEEEGTYDEETGRTKPARRVRMSFTDLVQIESKLRDVEWDEMQTRQAPSFRYHAHHGVALPHPSAVKLLQDRIHDGRRLGKVRTMLSLGCGSGVLPMMLTKGGVGHHRTVLTDPVANNVSSAAANMEHLGKRVGATSEGELLASATMPAAFVRRKVREANLASGEARIDGEYAQDDDEEVEDADDESGGARAGSAVCLQTEQSIFPTQEETPDEGFQLVLYATPHAGEAPSFGAVDDPVARSYEHEREALEEILHKADAYMAKHGRLVLVSDTYCEDVEGRSDPLRDVLLAPTHGFEIEASYAVKSDDYASFDDLLHHTATSKDVAAGSIRSSTVANTGRRRRRRDDPLPVGVREPRSPEEIVHDLPPGPFRIQAKLDIIKAKIKGVKPTNWAVARPLRKLGWSGINRANSETYYPEATEADMAAAYLADGEDTSKMLIAGDTSADAGGEARPLLTRLVILKRVADGPLRGVDLGQARCSPASMQGGREEVAEKYNPGQSGGWDE